MVDTEKINEIYVICDPSGWFKIGVTNHVPTRFKALQQSTPHELRLVTSITLNKAKPFLVERRVKTALAHVEHKGEWFKCDEATIVETVRKVVAGSLEFPKRQRPEMTNSEFAHALTVLGLTEHKAVRALCISHSHIRNILSGHTKVSKIVAKLLRFMLKHGVNGDIATRRRLPRKHPPFSKIVRNGEKAYTNAYR